MLKRNYIVESLYGKYGFGDPVQNTKKKRLKESYATDIDWDITEDDAEDIGSTVVEILAELPEKVLIPDDVDDEDVADYLSDVYGWLVNSFTLSESLDVKKNFKRSSSLKENYWKDLWENEWESRLNASFHWLLSNSNKPVLTAFCKEYGIDPETCVFDTLVDLYDAGSIDTETILDFAEAYDKEHGTNYWQSLIDSEDTAVVNRVYGREE